MRKALKDTESAKCPAQELMDAVKKDPARNDSFDEGFLEGLIEVQRDSLMLSLCCTFCIQIWITMRHKHWGFGARNIPLPVIHRMHNEEKQSREQLC